MPECTAIAAQVTSYARAQRAIADLKASICELLGSAQDGLSNAQIGRLLGIYQGHIGHEGHISRTLLEMMRGEGVVTQDTNTKRWSLRTRSDLEVE